MVSHWKVETKCSVSKRRSAAGTFRVEASSDLGRVVRRWKGLSGTFSGAVFSMLGIRTMLIVASLASGAARRG
jgi:hypothetical protein